MIIEQKQLMIIMYMEPPRLTITSSYTAYPSPCRGTACRAPTFSDPRNCLQVFQEGKTTQLNCHGKDGSLPPLRTFPSSPSPADGIARLDQETVDLMQLKAMIKG